MGNINATVKLTADTSQLRNDLKLIDDELRKRGSGSTPNNTWENSGGSGSSQMGNSYNDSQKSDDTYKGIEHEKGSKGDESIQKIERAERTRLYREITLIRKELQRLNNNWDSNSFGGGTTQSTLQYTSPNNTQSGGSTQLQLPGPTQSGSGTGSGSNTSGLNTNALGSILGKALTAGFLMTAFNRARNYVVSGYERETTAEHQAYNTYGSTLNYTDYKEAKEQARDIGYQFGYDYSETMSANKAYMQSGAGWTDAGSNLVNMMDLMGTAHATGADTQELASAAGKASGMGIDTSAFTSLFTNSIEMAGMTGREDEQLQVLESIADMLHETNVTVKEGNVADTMSIYNALVNNNENLKGSAGASMVNDINSAITGGGTSIYRALGYGTDIEPGMAGYLEVMRRASEGATTENLDRIFEYYTSMGITDEDTLKYIIGNAFNMNNPQGIQKLDELFKTMNYDEKTGTWSRWTENGETTSEGLLDKSAHEEYVEERQKNYNESDLATEEQYQLDKQDTQENISNWIGDQTIGRFHKWFSNLSPGGKAAATIGGGALSVAGGALGMNLLGKGLGKIFSSFAGGGAGAAGAGAAGEAAAGAAGAGGSWFSNILNKFGQGASGASGAAGGSSVWSQFTSGLNEGIGGKLWNWGKGFGESWFPKGEAGSSFADILDAEGNVIGRTRVSDVANSADDVVNAADDVLRGASNATSGASNGASSIMAESDNIIDATGDVISNFGDDAARIIGNNGDEAVEVLDAAGNIISGGADDTVNAIGSVISNYGDDAARAFGNYGDDAARIIGNFGDDAARMAGSAASGASGAAGGIANFIGKAALPIGVVLQTGMAAFNASQDDKRGDERAKSSHIGEGIGGVLGTIGGAVVGGATAGAVTGAVAGSVAPGVGNAIGLVAGGVVGGLVGLGGAFLGKEAGKEIYDNTNGEQQFTDEQLKQIHEYYEKVDAIYNKRDDYNGKSGGNAAQDYVKDVVVPYLNSIGVSTSHTEEYNTDVGKNDFLQDVDKGIYGKSGKDWEPELTEEEKAEKAKKREEFLSNISNTFGFEKPESKNKIEFPEFPEIKNEEEPKFPSLIEMAEGNGAEEFTPDTFADITGVNKPKDTAEEFNSAASLLDTTDTMAEDVSEIKDALENSDFSDGSDKIVQELKDENNQMPNWLQRLVNGLNGGSIGGILGGGLLGFATGGLGGGLTGAAIGGISSAMGGSDGSHAQGLDYVPKDDYVALLHKGEMVLTKDEADDYRSNGIYSGVSTTPTSGGFDININVNGAIQGMDRDNQQMIVNAIIAQLSQSNVSNMLSNGFRRVQNM